MAETKSGQRLLVITGATREFGRALAGEVAPYRATNWGIEGLTRALAEEHPAGMAAVPLNPGIIDTAMLRSCFGESAAGYPTQEEGARRAAPFLLGDRSAESGRALSAPG